MEISLILGVLVGAVLGLTGAGGGILAVPALIAGMGWTMQQAAPVALIAVAGSATVGNPSATAKVVTIGRPAAIASSALFCTPRAMRNGTIPIAESHSHGRTSGTRPVTVIDS